MRVARAIVRLIRVDFCSLIFLSVFAPLLARTHDLKSSFAQATPLFFIGVCTFVINDVDDRDIDAINHPGRPLPSGDIAAHTAVIIYFGAIAVALTTTRLLLDNTIGFWYYLLLIACTSYGYITEFLPSWKAPYVAACTIVPLLIVRFASHHYVSYAIISALFLFSLGRELCGDVIDRRGDRPAFVHRIPSTTVALAALHIQIAAVVLLAITIKSLAGRLVLMIFTAILAVAWHRWLADAKHEMALQFMKYDLFLGLYFIMV